MLLFCFLSYQANLHMIHHVQNLFCYICNTINEHSKMRNHYLSLVVLFLSPLLSYSIQLLLQKLPTLTSLYWCSSSCWKRCLISLIILFFYCLILFFQFKKISYIFNYAVFLFFYFLFPWFLSTSIRIFETCWLTIILGCVCFKKTHNFVFNTTYRFLTISRIQAINQSYQGVFASVFSFL